MKPIAVSPRAKTLNELLKKARRRTVILETADGEQFALTSLGKWVGFEVGDSDDFGEEVERTGENNALMKFLAARRKNGKAPGVPLAEVKKQLGFE